MTMFEGYDMSSLLSNASKPLEAFRAREAKRVNMSKPNSPSNPVFPVTDSLKPVQVDPIQAYIQANVLDKQTAYFDQLIKEQNLKDLWDFLCHSEDHSPVVPLAMNRLLNFYEGATRGGLSRSEVKAGMIVCLMASTVLSATSSMTMEQSTSPLAILYPRIKVDLKMPATANIDNLILLAAEKALGHLTRTAKPSADKISGGRMGLYLLDAFRMWLVSEDEAVIGFMATADSRMQHLKINARNSHTVRSCLGAGDITTYRPEHLCEFVTPWAKGKSMMRNAAGSRARLLAGMSA